MYVCMYYYMYLYEKKEQGLILGKYINIDKKRRRWTDRNLTQHRMHHAIDSCFTSNEHMEPQNLAGRCSQNYSNLRLPDASKIHVSYLLFPLPLIQFSPESSNFVGIFFFLVLSTLGAKNCILRESLYQTIRAWIRWYLALLRIQFNASSRSRIMMMSMMLSCWILPLHGECEYNFPLSASDWIEWNARTE